MNNYGNKFGYHTPELAEKFAALLNEAGIPFEDASWKNDECDRFSISFTPQVELHVWIGDPTREDDGYHTNMLSRFNIETGEIEHDDDIICGTFEEIIAKVKSMKADLLTSTREKLDACAQTLFGKPYAALTGMDNRKAFDLYLERHAIKGSY